VTIVVDASVALKWVVDEPGSEASIALQHQELIAPVFWLSEAANALWRRVRIGDLSADEASLRFAQLQAAPVHSVPLEPHVANGLEIGLRLNHPIYDCIYLAIAIEQNTHVITADRRFVTAANRPEFAGRVRLLGT